MDDPLFQWDEPYPYTALEPLGVTPQSTMRQVADSGFQLGQLSNLTQQERAEVWNNLRLNARRLVVDFFLYIDSPFVGD